MTLNDFVLAAVMPPPAVRGSYTGGQPTGTEPRRPAVPPEPREVRTSALVSYVGCLIVIKCSFSEFVLEQN